MSRVWVAEDPADPTGGQEGGRALGRALWIRRIGQQKSLEGLAAGRAIPALYGVNFFRDSFASTSFLLLPILAGPGRRGGAG